jgi:MFS family permease
LSARAAIVTTLFAQALGSAAIIAPTVVAPLIAASLGLPVVVVGLYVSLVYLSAMVASVASGPIIIGMGGTRVAQICLLLSALGLTLMGADWLVLAALGAILIGCGYGPLTPASSDVIMRAVPLRRISLAYAVKQSGTPLGGVLVGVLLPGLALALNWYAALLVVGGLCVALVAALTAFRASLDGERTAAVPRATLRSLIAPIRFILGDRQLSTLAISSLVFSAVHVSLTAYLVAFLTDLQWPLVAAGIALSVSQAAGTFGRIFWGWVADTAVGSKRTLLVLAVAMGVCSLAVLAVDAQTPRWAVLVLVGAYGLTAVGWSGVFIASVAKLAPSGKSSFVTGGALGFTYLGVVAGPPIFGVIASVSQGYQSAFAALAVPLFLCALLILRLPELGRDAGKV